MCVNIPALFPVALIKYSNRCKEERVYLTYNSRLQPNIVGKSR